MNLEGWFIMLLYFLFLFLTDQSMKKIPSECPRVSKAEVPWRDGKSERSRLATLKKALIAGFWADDSQASVRRWRDGTCPAANPSFRSILRPITDSSLCQSIAFTGEATGSPHHPRK